MRKSTRVGVLGVVVAAVFTAAMIYLLATIGSQSAETSRRILTVLGGFIGASTPYLLIWWWMLKRRGE